MYIVAIPTYNRSDIISSKSLTTLKEGRVDKKRIYLFVANKKEYDIYEKNVPKELYHKIIIGRLGITNQRNFIAKFFPENQYIVSMDDDVEEVLQLRGEKLVKVRDLDQFFREAYHILKKEHLFLWGVYPVRNAFFMQPTMTTDLRFVIGVLFGYINRPMKRPSIKSETKEDYEQTILYYFMDGGVVRFNNITIKTKFHAEGGLGTDRVEKNRLAAEYLKKTYPDIITIFHRKTGMPEVKVAKLPRLFS